MLCNSNREMWWCVELICVCSQLNSLGHQYLLHDVALAITRKADCNTMMSSSEQSSNKLDFSGDKLSTVRVKVGRGTSKCPFVLSLGLHQKQALTSDTERACVYV